MSSIRLLLLGWLMLSSVIIHAEWVITDGAPRSIWSEAQLLQDNRQKYQYDELLGDHPNLHSSWTTPKSIPNLGMTNDDIWVRLPIRNLSSLTKLTFTSLYPHLDYLTMYIYRYEDQRWQVVDALFGEHLNQQARSRSVNYTFDIKPKESILLLVKIRSQYPVRLPMMIGGYVDIQKEQLKRDALVYVSLGVLLALTLYNLFIYVVTLQAKYVFYCINLAFLQFFFFLDFGLVDIWWPQNHFLNRIEVWAITISVAFIFAILFAQNFLRLPSKYPTLSRFFWGMIVLVLSVIALELAGQPELALVLYLIVSMVYQVGIIAVSIFIVKEGFRPAKLFLFAWVFLAIGGAVYESTLWGVLPENLVTSHAFLIGTVIEALLLSWALAAYINHVQREQLKAERRFHEIVNKTNRKLAAALDEAERLSQVRDVFLTNITHELKTPLLSIAHTLDLVRQGMTPERELIMDANHSTRLIARHIDKLLLNTEINAGEPKFKSEGIELRSTLKEWQQDLQKEARTFEKQIVFTTNLHEWDEMNASLRALHLVINELVFYCLPIARDRIDLSLNYMAAQNSLTIKVSYQQLACAQRIHHTLKDGHMLGVGPGNQLGFVKSVIQILEGDFDHHVQTDGGASQGEEDRSAVMIAQVPDVVCCNRPSKQGLPERVLLVEDNKINQTVLGSMLKRMGVDYVVANNGAEALALQSDLQASLILMDCQMPVMNGFTATEQIRADVLKYGRPSIIAVSANSMEEDKARCLAVGMDDFVAKPVRMDQLREALQRWG